MEVVNLLNADAETKLAATTLQGLLNGRSTASVYLLLAWVNYKYVTGNKNITHESDYDVFSFFGDFIYFYMWKLYILGF